MTLFFSLLPIIFLVVYYVGVRYYPGFYRRASLSVPGILGLLLSVHLLYGGHPSQLYVVGALALLAAAMAYTDPYAVMSLATLSVIAMLIAGAGWGSAEAPVSPTVFVILASAYVTMYALFQVVNTIAQSRVYVIGLFAAALTAWTLSTIVYIMVNGGEALGYSIFQLSALASASALLLLWPRRSVWASLAGAAAVIAAMTVDSAGMLSGDILGYNPYGLVLMTCILTIVFQVLVVYRVVYGVKSDIPLLSPGLPNLVAAVGVIVLIAGFVGLITGHISYGLVSSYIRDTIMFTSLVIPLILIIRAANYSPAVVVGSILTAWASYEAGMQLNPGINYAFGVLGAWLALIAIYAALSRSVIRPLIATSAILAVVLVMQGLTPSIWSDVVNLGIPSEIGETTGASGLGGVGVNVSINTMEFESSQGGPCLSLGLTLTINPPNSTSIHVDADFTIRRGTSFQEASSGYEAYILKWPSIYKIRAIPSTSLIGGMLASCDYAGITGASTIYKELITGQLRVTVTRYNNVIELPLAIACIIVAALALDALVSRARRK